MIPRASFFSYKLKVKPEDFQVTERVRFPTAKKGRYRVYLLKKSGWNTTDLLQRLGRELRIPYGAFAYGGKKDRHAVTEQTITIARPEDYSFKADAYSLEAVGWAKKPIVATNIQENEFRITMRALPDTARAALTANIEVVQQYGLINYFDDQRFSTRDPELGFPGKYLATGLPENTLKIYLTSTHKEEKREAKDRKRAMRAAWGSWKDCLALAKTTSERRIFELLVAAKNDDAFWTAVNFIRRDDLSMLMSAYQSFLWNDAATTLANESAEGLWEFSGSVNEMLMFTRLRGDRQRYLSDLQLIVPGPDMKIEDTRVREIYDSLFEREQVSGFQTPRVRSAFFKSFLRPLLLRPTGLALDAWEPDDLYPGKFKTTVRFSLPRGAYGTMLVKRLTLTPRPDKLNKRESVPGQT